MREEDQVEAAVEAAAEADGGLRIAVCCAGTGWAQKVAGSKGPHPLLPFETIIEINLIGTFNVLRFAATGDDRATSPTRTASAASASTPRRSPPSTGRSARSPTPPPRAASSGMTLPAARDLSQYGIRVVTIAPGLFDTPLLAALPEEARTELGARSRSRRGSGRPRSTPQLAAHIVENPMLNGETIRLDGALRMAPR